LNYSQRQISGILKISQPTVSKILGKEWCLCVKC
jgi:predicted XRE-type DNA-binding protein